MNLRPTLFADIFRFAVAALFVALNIAFVTLPYVLSAHPGEAGRATATQARHMT